MMLVRLSPHGTDPSQSRNTLYDYEFETLPEIGDRIQISTPTDDEFYEVTGRLFKVQTNKSTQQAGAPVVALHVVVVEEPFQ